MGGPAVPHDPWRPTLIRADFDQGWIVTTAGSGATVGPVTVPYDAMLFEQRDPGTRNSHNTGFYPGGVYTYSKTFAAPRGVAWAQRHPGVRGRVHALGGAGERCPGGWPSVRVRRLPRRGGRPLEYGADNVVEVVAHNDEMPNSRWYTGSGIYRPVHLLVGERIRVTPHGLRITTTSVQGSDAQVNVATDIVNDGAERRDGDREYPADQSVRCGRGAGRPARRAGPGGDQDRPPGGPGPRRGAVVPADPAAVLRSCQA